MAKQMPATTRVGSSERLSKIPFGHKSRDSVSCKTFVHPGCMIPSRGDVNQELWEAQWFCDEHQPGRRSGNKLSGRGSVTGRQDDVSAAIRFRDFC